jgi:hypothetical protein
MKMVLSASALMMFALACVTRERVIVVKEPASSGTNENTGAGGAGETSSGNVLADPDRTAPSSDEPDWGIKDPKQGREYARVVEKVAQMPSDGDLLRRVRQRSLALINVMWEDTGRAEGSSLGPNISDLTLQVRRKDEQGQYQNAIMPVIRFPNFTDRTGDVPADRFFIRVGNEHGGGLRSVPLTDVLRNLKAFASHPESILGDGNLLASRDTHFLVSAQAVFLPIPKSGKAQFNPVLFNYQSAPSSPAVLSILVTRQGTSVQVVENKPEDATAAGWGQELYFNNKGQRAAFTAERKSDVERRIESQGGPRTEDDKSALERGADVLFLVQVPLKHRNMGRLGGVMMAAPAAGAPAPAMAPAPQKSMAQAERSDVEQAVLGHGPNLGPFHEGHDLRLERDPTFPVRITVQFYKATSNGVASDSDLDSIARSIGSVYEHAEYVGSLVLPDGDPRRPTAWQKVPHEWFPW